MRFDDRLLTVLNQPAGDRHDRTIRWRQLVDLVARAGSNAASPAVEQALESIRADAPEVDETLRAAAARAVAALPLPLGLLDYFASERPSVAAPVLAAATLDPTQWRAILSGADEETRRFVATLHPDVQPAESAELTDLLVERAPIKADDTPAPPPAPSIHELVERIEERRRSRATVDRGGSSATAEASPVLFHWECGPGGEIAWVDGAPRGAVIGRSIARAVDGDRLDPAVVRAFTIRAPFRDATLTIGGEGPIAGEWTISGVPAFEAADGRFAGYRGTAVREQTEAVEPVELSALLSDPASLRELVHEIKTPLNAIIGFAEIIEGQYLGPADRPYRARAHDIVRQGRLLVTAIDDLDFAAKLHAAGGEQHADLGELGERIAPVLSELAAACNVELDASPGPRGVIAAAEPELAARLVLRMCSAMIEQASSGERLHIRVESSVGRPGVSVTRPLSLRGLPEEQLFGAQAALDQGFKLRLVRGLARLAGAELSASENEVSLLFPRG